VLFTALLSVAGCVSMPSGGPVQSYVVTQGTDAQSQQFMQLQPQQPGANWSPLQVVQGFLTASPSFNAYRSVVNQYLTPYEQKHWKPDWSAEVYRSGPTPEPPTYLPNSAHPASAVVDIDGSPQATLKGIGGYSVSTSSQGAGSGYSFKLQKVGSQWRIASAPSDLLLTSDSFEHDYQLTNLYFFDPTHSFLVPDPVYVPLGASPQELMNGLVGDLIEQPKDWLAGGATTTAFPAGTGNGGVVLNGATATVDLKGAVTRADSATLTEVSAQLWSTLDSTTGQGGQQVKAVEVLLNGKPWFPPGSKDGNPVVRPLSGFNPPSVPTPPGTSSPGSTLPGAGGYFYYLDSTGYLIRANSNSDEGEPIAKIGTGYDEIAVSPDADSVDSGAADSGYVAVLHGNVLSAGLIGEPLINLGSGYTGISWDRSDNLWATTGSQIVMFPASSKTPLSERVAVKVDLSDASPSSAAIQGALSYSQIAVAPDGIRVAIVQSGTLIYGAISGSTGPEPTITLSRVQEQPTEDGAVFQSLAWYGPDNVITLAASGTTGPAVTVYPVSGGAPDPIATDSNMVAISARFGQPLVADLFGDGVNGLVTDANQNGSWMKFTSQVDLPSRGTPVAYPG
jgi:hypothetical protein